MRAALGSFKVKLVVYFLLLSLLPIAAAFWGFASVAGQSETRRVDARLQAGLRSALTAYQERVDAAQNAAQTLARDRTFQVELQKGNVPELREMLRDATDLYVVGAGNAFHVGRPPILAAQRQVQVYTRVGLVGTVVGYVPYDTTLLDALRNRSGLAPTDALAALQGSKILASSPDVNGSVALAPGRTKTVRVSGDRYRALVARVHRRRLQRAFRRAQPPGSDRRGEYELARPAAASDCSRRSCSSPSWRTSRAGRSCARCAGSPRRRTGSRAAG